MSGSSAGGRFPAWFLLVGLLTIAFVVLRLTGVIEWSWWFVLAPLWVYALVRLSLFLTGLLLLLVAVVVEALAGKPKPPTIRIHNPRGGRR